MNSLKFLYAAYIATWVIHGLYIGSMLRRYKLLRERMKNLAASRK